ncbi:MAG: uracil-DNA glycosylase family protein, partial [Pseudomonadota bacterium]
QGAAETALSCHDSLRAAAAQVRPRVILAVGRVAAQNLLSTAATVDELRGTAQHLAEGDDATPVAVTLHPADLLRSPADKASAWQDLCLAMDLADR